MSGRVRVGDVACSGREPSTASDALQEIVRTQLYGIRQVRYQTYHDDQAGAALRVSAQVLRAKGEDHLTPGMGHRHEVRLSWWAGVREVAYRVADGLEEEQREHAADAGVPGTVGHAEREGHACDGMDAQHERGVDPLQKDDADEAMIDGCSTKRRLGSESGAPTGRT